MKNVESFFKTQVAVFDDAVRFVESMKNDLDYISHDEEANHALNQMRLITLVHSGQPYNYKRIPELNDLKAIVEKSHDAMLEEKRAELYEVVRSCLEAIHENSGFNERTKVISERADQFYTQKKGEIAGMDSLALLDGLSVPMWGYKDRAVQQIEDEMKPKPQPPVTPPRPGSKPPVQPKKIIKKAPRQSMFPAKTLTTDEEIDAYVESIRKQMKQYLKGSDGIQII
jgi:hypothetical protein